MTHSEEIHSSISDADDLEEIHGERLTVGEVCYSLARHPLQMLTRWNWKAALVGALIRIFFYITVYRASRENWVVTLTAVMVEFIFRFTTSGISGSIIQSFRNAHPQWLGTLIVSITLPIFGHLVEFMTHYGQETYFSSVFAASENNGRQKAFAISVLISVLSSVFNLFAMRDGVLLVGAGSETKTLWEDAKRIPALLLEFMMFLPIQMLDFLRSKKFAAAFGIFLAFGISIGTIMGVFRGKWSWAWTTALGSWAIMFVWTILVAAGLSIYNRRVKTEN